MMEYAVATVSVEHRGCSFEIDVEADIHVAEFSDESGYGIEVKPIRHPWRNRYIRPSLQAHIFEEYWAHIEDDLIDAIKH